MDDDDGWTDAGAWSSYKLWELSVAMKTRDLIRLLNPTHSFAYPNDVSDKKKLIVIGTHARTDALRLDYHSVSSPEPKAPAMFRVKYSSNVNENPRVMIYILCRIPFVDAL